MTTLTRGRPRLSGDSAPIQWSDEMTDKLFELRYRTLASWFMDWSKRRQLCDGWALVAAELSKEFAITASVDQCRNKIKSAKRRCAQYLKDNTLRGVATELEAPLRLVETVRFYCGDQVRSNAVESSATRALGAAASTTTTVPSSSRQPTAIRSSTTVIQHSVEREQGYSSNNKRKTRGRPRLSGEGAIHWDDDMTEKLIQLRFEALEGEFESSHNYKYHLGDMWSKLAAQLSDALGSRIEPDQCRNKVKAMTARWAQYLESLQSQHGGTDDVDFESEPRWVQIMRQYCSEHVADEEELEEVTGGETHETHRRVIAEGRDGREGVPDDDDINDEAAERDDRAYIKKIKESREDSLHWSDAMTEKLFQLRYETLRSVFDNCTNNSQLHEAWKRLALQLSDACGDESIDMEKCRNKLKSMNKCWSKYKEARLEATNVGDTSAFNSLAQPRWVKLFTRYCGSDESASSEAEAMSAAPRIGVASLVAVSQQQHTADDLDSGTESHELRRNADADDGEEDGDAPDNEGVEGGNYVSNKKRKSREDSLHWSDAMTEKLFQLRYRTLRSVFANCTTNSQLHEAWKLLATQLSLTFGDEGIDMEKCRNKIKAMNKRWNQYKEAHSQASNDGDASSFGLQAQPWWVELFTRYCESEESDESEEVVPPVAPPSITPPVVTVPSQLSPAAQSMLQNFITVAPAFAQPIIMPTVSTQGFQLAVPPMLPSNGVAGSGHVFQNSFQASNASNPSICSNDNPVLVQILRAIEGQREAAIQQTRSIQELLQFLREERSERQQGDKFN